MVVHIQYMYVHVSVAVFCMWSLPLMAFIGQHESSKALLAHTNSSQAGKHMEPVFWTSSSTWYSFFFCGVLLVTQWTMPYMPIIRVKLFLLKIPVGMGLYNYRNRARMKTQEDIPYHGNMVKKEDKKTTLHFLHNTVTCTCTCNRCRVVFLLQQKSIPRHISLLLCLWHDTFHSYSLDLLWSIQQYA